MFWKKWKILTLLFIAVACLLVALPAAASTLNDKEALPWETPLKKIVNSLTGYWAYAVMVLAFVASGAMLYFGQTELQSWVRTLLFLIMCSSFLMGGGVFAKNVLNLSGMLLP